MTTIEQCRGARGILGWTQQDLADASGLSKTAINNFEKKHSDIKAESLKAIRMAFESADIEFIGEQGVSKKQENTRILRGDNILNDLVDDIHQTLTQQKSDILIANVDSNLQGRITSQKLFQHIDFLKTHDIQERIISTENITHILSPSDECRYFPGQNSTNSITTYIYGGKVAIELWKQSMIIIINSADASAAERERFENLWAHAQTSTAGTATDQDNTNQNISA